MVVAYYIVCRVVYQPNIQYVRSMCIHRLCVWLLPPDGCWIAWNGALMHTIAGVMIRLGPRRVSTPRAPSQVSVSSHSMFDVSHIGSDDPHKCSRARDQFMRFGRASLAHLSYEPAMRARAAGGWRRAASACFVYNVMRWGRCIRVVGIDGANASAGMNTHAAPEFHV